MTYRFIGTLAEIRDVADLKYFGQSVELSEKLYEEAVLGSCALLPEADFAALGFTDQEIKKYANPGARQSAPPSFQKNFEAARNKLHDNREKLEREANEEPVAAESADLKSPPATPIPAPPVVAK